MNETVVSTSSTSSTPATPATPAATAPRAARHTSPLPTWAWLAGAGMLAAIVGLTTALVQRAGEEARAQADPLALSAPPGAGPADEAARRAAEPPLSTAQRLAADEPAHRTQEAPRHTGRAAASAGTAGAATGGTASSTAAEAEAPRTTAAAACSTCGVVESVRAVQVAGQGTGLGAVAGGVLGGVVGNQFGKGSGNTAMTVLGAVGGGYAGHQVEKRVRSHTAYQVHVRMSDGSLRTLQSGTDWPVGARVRVDGNRITSDASA